MTTSSYKKVFKQLKVKPAKLAKFIKHNAPKERKFGRSTKKCKICGREHASINKYKLNICRTCFRDIATKIGFKKYN
ncbi:30S ribosomal protein S14 [Candidatus Woesearchaeota archaeon]|nr:30S ribosomal protein S14 [Candidatus Woesearchaeota archaeon]MBL7050596.1 30S ribosomal protein S14 [Candidatus Woesearchaeota archaeon]